MRTVTAVDVRKHFGQLLDEAASGERIVIERSGQPMAALVPLADLALVDPKERRALRLAALDDLRRIAAHRPLPGDFDAAAALRTQRRERQARIGRVVGG
ncbi:MAG: type II toxin-antitoxin system Phd/YefM family antitoxin [Chloroflexi bacterium]|nr:type II toxin-antitoxin system Phd/YefM family antitoxin [Chloroflexota bacterium]